MPRIDPRCVAKFKSNQINVKPTHLCCHIVKQIRVCQSSSSDRHGGYDVSYCCNPGDQYASSRPARMRSADLPGLRRFHGGCGSVGLSVRQRHQLSLDLRYLRLWLRNQAFGQAVCLQLELAAASGAFSSESLPLEAKTSLDLIRGGNRFARSKRVKQKSRTPFPV